jgi:hypothetical protein
LINAGVGIYGEASLGVGPAFIGISGNAGVNVENRVGIFFYRGLTFPRGLRWGWSARLGAAVGGELTFY